jgi:thioredoxin reductase
MDLPLIGKVKVREISKEELMELWADVLRKARPNIRFNERMEDIAKEADGFVVTTSRGSYRAAQVLLAIGRRGTPRKLEVPGEVAPKVVYRLIEAEQYRGMDILVVGGGDSALEAALDVAAEEGTTVTLSYRGAAFNRVKPKNRSRMDEAVAAGRVRLILESSIQSIDLTHAHLKKGDEKISLPVDHVIVCAGGELPTPMLKKIGVQVDARYGT